MQIISLSVLLLGTLWPRQGGATNATDENCQLAKKALGRRDFASAEGYLKKCLASRPPASQPYLDLCAIYQMLGKTSELHQVALEGLKRFPEEKRFYLTVGNQAGNDQRYERAVEVFSQAFERWPDDHRFREALSSSHLLLGMKLLDERKDKEAHLHLQEAVRLNDKDVEAHLNLGRVLHNLNQSLQAHQHFDRVLAIDPDTPLAYFHRGLVRNSIGDYDGATTDLTEEIKRNPSYPPSYLLRGQALISKGKWLAALADLEMAAKKMPENPRAQFDRARCLSQLGRVQEAEAAFRKALEIDPSNPDVYNSLGRLLSVTNRIEEAQQMFQRARELNRQTGTAGDADIRFESAQSIKKVQ